MTDTTGPATAAGRSVGNRYRLLAKLGEGGFGEVWRARDRSLDIDVAVKQVRLPPTAPQAQRAAHAERALREARHAAKLRDHPNVVAVHDVVDDAGPWIVMQMVQGRTLAERIKRDGPLSEPDAVHLAISLLQALRAAQRVKIVHRDIKPANVMLTDDGEVLLTDFGIAVHDADPSITASGVVLGSAEYMAPERARGNEATYASDLFSLGVTLYHAVEGVSPFHRETPTGSLAAVLLDNPPKPERAGVLEPLLGALLYKDPDNRPDIAGAFEMAHKAADHLDPDVSRTRVYSVALQPIVTEPPKEHAGKAAAALLAKAINKSAIAAILRADDRIQAVRHNRRLRATQATAKPTQPGTSSNQPEKGTDKGRTGANDKGKANLKSKTSAIRPSPWQSKALFLLMLAIFGLALYALKHAEIPSAWHPVTADQTARDALQQRIDPKKDNVSPGWWLAAPTAFIVITTATLWSMTAVRTIPAAAGATVKVVVGIVVFAAGSGAGFAAIATGAGIFHTWLPPIGALWASAAALTAILTVAIGWAVEADTKRKNAAKKKA